jgi:DNA polymerase I-like protein with 3'-5' exonuclease and polymerase domains
MPRVSTIFNIAGTDTFRLASKTILETWGTNLQNQDKKLLYLFLADPGKSMVQVDQSGAEALIVAYLCRAGQFRELFLHGIKPHVFVALHNFGDNFKEKEPKFSSLIDKARSTSIAELKTLDGWKELDRLIKDSDNWENRERYYFIAKMIAHASNYGMKGPTFQMNVLEKSEGKIVLTRAQADAALLKYHRLFPEIEEWHRKTMDILYRTNTLYNLQGFPRYFHTVNDSMMKDALAFVPQSTVGTISNIAYTRLQEHIETHPECVEWDLLNNKHDSYLAQVPEADVMLAAKLMKTLMEQELISPTGVKFRMRSEAQAGKNWAPYKPSKNELGLQEVNV